MTSWQIVMLVAAIVLTDVAVVILLIRWITQSLKDAFEDFPAREIPVGAVARSFQTVRLNSTMNFGGCIRIAVDERMLHLRPMGIARFFGFPSASVPWESTRTLRVRGSMSEIAIGATKLRGPTWALSLAPKLDQQPGLDSASQIPRIASRKP